MKALTITAVALAFMAANVVAAGVTRVLGEITLSLAPEISQEPWPWIFVGAAGVGAAVIFLQGAVPAGMRLVKFFGRR